VAQRRIEHARRLLKTTSQPLQQIADACGYADLSHFSHRFRDSVGAPPSRYRSVVAQRDYPGCAGFSNENSGA
jgi:AraC family transcriptional regulator